ncbi:hypothetical protein ADA01nite_31290 [Aneurinibacillus danicus]|uniref:Uncharacterized protein n=2 Tax=Aneurinibacillus danicus TaxID=267746 RepID=A0A511VA00_9BACL|nr:hypothetical protein [Aneurinibacillus danicus]GEN35669.1 hypothetical protein ADA01nite_31290 [Aneurinibacillus danicus]
MEETAGKRGHAKKLLSLFMAAALVTVPAGCSSDDECYDQDNDGYCDDDGRAHTGSYVYGSDGKKKFAKKSGISSGSKGGIGGSGWSSS